MYTDILFNFTQITHDQDSDFAARILEEMAVSKPFFAMDCGLKADDIFSRVDFFKQCLEQIDNDNAKACIKRMMYFCAGIMPDTDSVENRYEYIELLEDSIKNFKNSGDEFEDHLVAIGPCGIDHDWDSMEYSGREHDFFDSQTILDEKDLFALEMTLGKKLNMPLVVHSRKGFTETADVIKAVKWNKGVIHGYSYSKSELDFFLDLGWYISFSGSVTYAGKKGAQDMAETVAYVPSNRILIETDSPFYTPVPIKNQINTPNNISYIYDYIAAKRNISTTKLFKLVDENAKKLFME